MKKIFNYSCLVYLCVNLAIPSRSMDIQIPSRSMDIQDDTPSQSREEAVQEVIELLDSNARVFEIAYKLSLSIAKRYYNNEQSDDLMQQVKQWMGSAGDFGKDHNWPLGLREDSVWIGINILRASTFWLDMYTLTKKPSVFLQQGIHNDIRLKIVREQLAAIVKNRKLEKQYSVQTQDEIENFGEYPPIDFDGLIYKPLEEIIDKLNNILQRHIVSSAVSTTTTNSEILISESEHDKLNNKYNSLFTDALNGITKEDNKLLNASIWYMSNYTFNNTEDGDMVAVNNIEIVDKLSKLKDSKSRNKFVYTKINLAFSSSEKLINNFSVLLQSEQQMSEPVLAIEKEQQRKPHKKNNKSHGKKGKKKPSQAKKSKQVIAKDADDEDAEETTNPQDEPHEEIVIPAPTVTTAIPSTTKASTTNSRKKYEGKKNQKSPSVPKVAVVAPKAPGYCLDMNPYLTQEVTEKFLDIFGNRQGDVRSKKASIYQRQGWSTIDELEKVLSKAGWLVNQRETATGVVNEKHKSSTISFRMPNTGKNLVAPIIKFHDDHKAKQDMREITRNFIIGSLEYFGYTEDFLEKYYVTHFVK